MMDPMRVLVTLDTGSGQQRSVMLPDPRTGKPRAYMLATDGSTVLELQRYKSTYSSWVVQDTLVADGSLFMATPVEPLFLLLPLLERSRNRPSGAEDGGYFCSLEQVLEDAQHPHLTLLAAAAAQHCPCICDTKDAGDCAFYRLNDQLVLAWLQLKAAQVKDAVQGLLAGMEEEAQLAYVISFLGEYVQEVWTARLAQALGVDVAGVASAGAAVGSARPAPAGATQATQDKRPKVDPKAAARKKAEETRAANLAKQAQGTKSITNFFRPRST